MESRIVSTTDLIGASVINKEWERVGTIHSLVVDRKTGAVLYALLSFGGFWWGTEDKYFAVPLKAFDYEATTDDRIVLDVNKEKFESSPGFDKDSWPLEPTDEFIHSIFSHYGLVPYSIFDRRLRSSPSEG